MTDITPNGVRQIKKTIGFTIIILQILALIAIQFALATETVREVFTQIDALEGRTSAAIIDNVGTVEIELTAQPVGDAVPSVPPNENDISGNAGGLISPLQTTQPQLRILVNGQLAGYFGETLTTTLAVRGNSLIEIDATNEPTPHRIRVTNISDNAMQISRNLEVTTNQNIAILGKIFAQ